MLKDLDDEIEELKVTPEVDTSGDLEYALMLDELLKEKEEKRAQAKHKQRRDDERLAQEMQMRLAEERNSRKPTLKVIEISSSDSDQDGHVVVKQEAASGTAKCESAELVKRARLATPSPHPPRITTTHEEDKDSPMKRKKVAKVTKHKKEKHGSEEGKSHKHKHAKKKLAYSISPPPSVSPPSVSPPSVSPPSVPPSVPPPMKPAAAGKNKPLPVKRGRKSKHNWTIDEYLHMANTLSAPRFETPTVALRTLHRGHLLLDITSANVLRNAWQHLRTGVTSPLHDPRAAHALEYVVVSTCLTLLTLSIQSDRATA